MSNRHGLAFRPRVERLEDRTVPTLFTVNTTAVNLAVDGLVSLQEAIQAANTNLPAGDAPAGSAGLDTIQFAPGLNGQTITVTTSGGLLISEDLTITGPGANRLALSGGGTTRIFNVFPGGAAGANVTIQGLTLTQGRNTGGAILNQGNLSLADTVFTANSSSSSGGGVYNFGTLAITNSTFARNSADLFGGGVHNQGTLTVSDSTFSGNTSGNLGGGISSFGGTMTIANCTFNGNTAAFSGGGGIYNGGVTRITGTTLFGNTTRGGGGGISNWNSLTLIGSTLAGNVASGTGGGIENNGGYFVEVANSTIAGNSSGGGGGGINSASMNTASNVIVTSTIVAGNSAAGPGQDLGGAFTLTYSLVQAVGDYTYVEPAPGTNLFGLDPLLGPLTHNGGPTLTRALLPDSPALDRGFSPPTTAEDQRGYGFDRVVGAAADIGAVESRDSDVRVVPDPLDRLKRVLVVVGTRKPDAIALRRDGGDLEVTVNGELHVFDAATVGRAVAFGMEGNDAITSALPISVLLHGGRGADTLTGGGGHDVLIGAAGADVLLGGGGFDILIGGDGVDKLTGGAGDDLLVGGRTTYDRDQDALALILAEWTSARTYAERRANLAAGTGVPQLAPAQVTDGFAGDVLTGDVGLELFFRGPGDALPGKAAAETAVGVA